MADSRRARAPHSLPTGTTIPQQHLRPLSRAWGRAHVMRLRVEEERMAWPGFGLAVAWRTLERLHRVCFARAGLAEPAGGRRHWSSTGYICKVVLWVYMQSSTVEYAYGGRRSARGTRIQQRPLTQDRLDSRASTAAQRRRAGGRRLKQRTYLACRVLCVPNHRAGGKRGAHAQRACRARHAVLT